MEFVKQQSRLACEHAAIVLTEKDWEEFAKMAHSCLARRLTTPRQAIRFGNALRFALPMMKGEVNVLDQMGIEGLRVLYPELYAAIRDNKELFTIAADPEKYPVFDNSFALPSKTRIAIDEVDKRFDRAARDMSPDEAASGRLLIKFLFERYRPVPQGVVLGRYFDRYFSYGIGGDEIGDIEIKALTEGSADDIPALLEQLLDRDGPALLQLLLMRIPEFDMEAAIAVARLLVHNGPKFQAVETIDPRYTAFLIASLVFHVVSIQESVEQSNIVLHDEHDIMQVVGRDLQPLSLALYFSKELESVVKQKRSRAENRGITYESPIRQSDWNALNATLAKRLADEAAVNWRIMMADRFKASPMIFEWNKLNATAQRQWLSMVLRNHPEAVVRFLHICITDTSELSFSVNENTIKSMAEIDEVANAAHTLAVSLTNDSDDVLKAFLAWRQKRQKPEVDASGLTI